MSNLMERIEMEMKNAASTGWELTRMAMGADSEEKADRMEQARDVYRSPLYLIAEAWLEDDLSLDDMKTLRKDVILVRVNEFDLYRRLGFLGNANKLGTKTLEDAVRLGDKETTLRTGNFMTLVHSAQAYESIDKKRYAQALEAFRENTETFQKMPLDEAEGLTAIMLYANKAANHLNIVRVKEMQGRDDYQEDLDAAKEAADEASRILYGQEAPLSALDSANWKANIASDLGDIAMYRGDHEGAVEHYEMALAESESAEYETQTAVIQAKLAHALCHAEEPDMVEIEALMDPVESYLRMKDFGIYNSMYMPMVEKVRDRLAQD